MKLLFHFGLLIPWGAVHILAVLLLFLACFIQCRHNDRKNNTSVCSWTRETFGLLLMFLFFDVAWGFVFYSFPCHKICQLIFIVSSCLLGLTIFVFFCLFSSDVRKKWTAWLTRGRYGLYSTSQPQAREEGLPLPELRTAGKSKWPASTVSMEACSSGDEFVVPVRVVESTGPFVLKAHDAETKL